MRTLRKLLTSAGLIAKRRPDARSLLRGGNISTKIRRSFSNKLSVAILLLAAPIFLVSLGILFTQSRFIIRKEAMGRANSMLGATIQRVSRHIIAIETATNSNSWFVTENLQPDSLLHISRRVVSLNPLVDGCSVSTEPDVFPAFGRHFSAYTIRKKDADGRDTIVTVIENEYEYFDKVWYKKARQEDKPVWTVFYEESDTLSVTLDGLIASYSKPLYRDDTHAFVAIISTDLSLLRLSKFISAEEKPYTNSYYMLVDNEGHYSIHPDTTRLFHQTIFSGVDPGKQSDLVTLGHEMTAGHQGHISAEIDGVPSLVCYQPVPGTSWSLALVSPESDVFAGYHKQVYILLPLLIGGLLVILLLCRRAVAAAISPLNELLVKTQAIAQGNMEVHIPNSQREDAVGRLQNSFATMLRSLQFHMGSVRFTSEQTRQRNEELAQATRLAREADSQKTAFIQNVSHQIRTPLNIIMGFAQVLDGGPEDSGQKMSIEELKTITDAMSHNSKLLNRMVLMLYDCSDKGLSEELTATSKLNRVPCNDTVREAISGVRLYSPHVNINFKTDFDDSFCIRTNRQFLARTLRELLYNSAKYSDKQNITIRVGLVQNKKVRFVIEDTGKGIAKADSDLMFKFFVKFDDLSEGLGLGLPLAKRHAMHLGGDLKFDADYQGGCRFIIDLPL
jgi:signal transduction histidine kinase